MSSISTRKDNVEDYGFLKERTVDHLGRLYHMKISQIRCMVINCCAHSASAPCSCACRVSIASRYGYVAVANQLALVFG
jgi:hypothetical protein